MVLDFNSSAQNGVTSQRYNSKLQQSPDISSLGTFGDIPVGKYTGVLNFTIPLYTIKVKDYQLPISISYQTSGIKVSEEASSVGLGWALSCGGVISQVINGRNDLAYDYGYKTHDIPDPGAMNSNYEGYPFGCNSEIDYTTILTKHDNFFLPYKCVQIEPDIAPSSNFWDSEPDLFYYNFGEYSGKFFWHKATNSLETSSFQTMNREKFIIVYLGLDAGWQITTPDGVQYLFNCTEHYVSCSHSFDQNGSFSTTPGPESDSYYLKEVKLPSDEVITFNYTPSSQICQLAETSEDWVYQDQTPGSPQNTHYYNSDGSQGSFQGWGHNYHSSQTYYFPIFLDNIQFPNGTITLNWQERLDINQGKRLTGINILNNYGIAIKNIIFNNESYFQGQTSATSAYVFASCDVGTNFDCGIVGVNVDNILYKRLKLSSLTISDQINPYVFSYDETNNLPSKQSYAQDYWGYFNGNISETKLLSQFYFEQAPAYNSFTGLNLADRTANDNSKAWVLNRIDYPTGGYTEMVFEPNTFSNYQYPVQTGMVNKFCKGGGLRIKSIKDYDPASVSKEKTYVYEHVDIDGNIKSYGKVMDLPKINRIFKIYAISAGELGTLEAIGFNKGILYGESARGLSPTAQGNYVGYDKVIEILGNDQHNRGQIEYNFTNESYYCNLESIAPCRYALYNGTPTLTVYKNSEGIEIKKESYTYHAETDLIKSYGIKFELSSFGYYPKTYNVHSYPIQVSRINLESKTESLFDANQQAWISKTTSYEYNPSHLVAKESTLNSDGNTISVITKYPLDYVNVSSITYTQLHYLVDKHILSATINSSKLVDGLLTDCVVTEYDGLYPKTIYSLETTEKIDVPSYFDSSPEMLIIPPELTQYMKPKIHFTYENGNLISELKEPNLQSSYIWGYNNSYPIAGVVNAATNECDFTGFEGNSSSGWNIASSMSITYPDFVKTGKYSVFLYSPNGVSESFTVGNNASLHTGYKASVWVKSGIGKGFIEIGIDGHSANRVYNTILAGETESESKWHLLEVELPHDQLVGNINASLKIKVLIGCTVNTGAYFDDLRFYPMDAHMKTYTYEPLVGMTSESDFNNKSTTYKYDSNSRLWYTSDYLGNILKKFDYHYYTPTP